MPVIANECDDPRRSSPAFAAGGAEQERLITFTEGELRSLLIGIFHNDSTRLEHHQANRMGEFPPTVDGRKLDRWFEPKEIVNQIAKWKLGDSDFLHLKIDGCERGEPGSFESVVQRLGGKSS